VEKVITRAGRNHHVTRVVLRPEGAGPFPACWSRGHSDKGKAGEAYRALDPAGEERLRGALL